MEDDDILNDSNEILDFINKQCKSSDYPDDSKIITLFSKCIKDAIIKTYEQQNNIILIIICVDIVHTIFNIIITYSHNSKLTMFLIDRAIILFNEYINVSHTYISDKVNFTDIKSFIINKTIGPLTLNNTHLCVKKELLYLKKLYISVTDKIIKHLDSDPDFHIDLYNYFDYLGIMFIPHLCQLSLHYHYNALFEYIQSIINSDSTNILIETNLFIIKSQLLIEINKKEKNKDRCIIICNEFVKETINPLNYDDYFENLIYSISPV